MLLKQVQVRNFRNILDSTAVIIEPSITCLVGKNESGKSAFLQALHRLNPAYSNVGFDVQKHYPAWLEKRHRKEGKDLDSFEPISVTYELEKGDQEALEKRFGKGAVQGDTVTVSREYGGRKLFGFKSDEKKAIDNIFDDSGLSKEVQAGINSFDDLAGLIKRLHESGDPAQVENGNLLQTKRSAVLGKAKDFAHAVIEALSELQPVYFYFDEYSALKGTVKIHHVLETDVEKLDDSDRTARALLEQGGADGEYLLNPDYETRKRELENVANSITHEVLEYWSTNPELRVVIDITQKTVSASNGQKTVLEELKIRLWDDRHLLSLPFDERSTGFRWFFSFLAAFSEFEHKDRKTIILLDEPGVGLHARAQKDFLRFIEERLAKKSQVLFTTHSPFMVQPEHLERARLVEDSGRDVGSRVTSDVLSTDRDTIFPLQGALGYDLVQHLFVATNNVVVEGTSDFTYLQILSDHLASLKREGLNPKWSIVPVGGADLVPTFVALLGMHLKVTVVVDSRKEGHQRLLKLAQQKILDQNRLITIGQVLGTTLGDIEDLFEAQEYLDLYNQAFGRGIKLGELVGNDPIVSRIARKIGVDRFDHGKPAEVLLRNRDKLLPMLSKATLDRFETLFQKINRTMP